MEDDDFETHVNGTSAVYRTDLTCPLRLPLWLPTFVVRRGHFNILNLCYFITTEKD